MLWYCSSSHLLPARQPALGRSALSELFKIYLAQAEKKTGSQADPSRPSCCMLFSCLCLDCSVQPLQVCLFFSLSHTQSCDVSATFVQGSAPIGPYSRKLSIMTAMENNVNIFKRREAEGYRKGCRIKHKSENTLPCLLGKVSFMLKCDEPEVVLTSGIVFPFAIFRQKSWPEMLQSTSKAALCCQRHYCVWQLLACNTHPGTLQKCLLLVPPVRLRLKTFDIGVRCPAARHTVTV